MLMNATGNWHTAALDDGAGPGWDTDNPIAVGGACSLRMDGSSTPTATRMGESFAGRSGTPVLSDGTMALTDLSDRMFAATHTVDLFCSELDGDLDWTDLRLVRGARRRRNSNQALIRDVGPAERPAPRPSIQFRECRGSIYGWTGGF